MPRTLLGLLVFVLIGCRDRSPPEEPAVVPAAVLVEPRALSLGAGDSEQLSAQANDALGQPIGGAPLSFETADPDVVRVTSSGFASSTGSAGSAQIVVSSGGTKAIVPVTVTPADAGRLEKIGGDGQRGEVSAALEGPVAVRSLDAYGNPVPGTTVLFAPRDGGSVQPPAATTDAAGVATTVWTLGRSAGLQRLSAALEAAPAAAELITATAVPGAPANLTEVAPSGAAPVADAEAVVRVRVADSNGNAIPGAEIAWRAVTAGTAVSPSTSTTDAAGLAEARVRTAAKVGANRVEARAAGLARPLELTLAAVAGPAAGIEVVRGDRQTGVAHRPAKVGPTVRVVDANGNPVAGVPVRFEVAAGGGTVELGVSLTDASGVAGCGRWTLGAAGTNELAVSADGVEAAARIAATARRR